MAELVPLRGEDTYAERVSPCGDWLGSLWGSHVRGLDASSPLRRIRQLISLIITPARTNDPPTGSMHLGGNPNPSHHFSRWVIRSHDDPFPTKERRFLSSTREISTNILTNTTTEKTTVKI